MKTIKNNFYTLVYDSIWDNPLSSKPNYLAVFIFIVSHAYKKDKEIIVNNQKLLIKRGQWFGSILKIAQHFSISTASVLKILKYFKSESIIESKSTNKFTLFTVLNYDGYQPELKAKVKTKEKQSENKKIAGETKDNVYNVNDVDKDNILERSPSYLKNIPREDLITFGKIYCCNENQIINKGEALAFWLEKKGRTYKNYRAALQDCLLKDFGKRKIIKEIKIPKGVKIEYV